MKQKDIMAIDKELLYNICLEEVMKLKIDSYHTRFLASMVLGKIRHSEEDITQLARKAMAKMPERYQKKKNILAVRPQISLFQLEKALEKIQWDEELLRGVMLENIVEFLAERVQQQLEEIVIADDV